MKTFACLLLALAHTVPVAFADPKAEVTAAVLQLETQSGYSWSYTPKTDGSESARRQQSPLTGKTERESYTLINGQVGDISVDIGIKGDKMVVNYSGDWLSTAEIGENNRTVQRLRMLRRPTDEARTLIEKATNVKADGDGVFSSELNSTWSKELFALLGRRAADAPSASGTVKFWIKAGLLAKYEFIIRGKIKAGEGKAETEVSRTTTVEIKDVGNTKVILPEDARKKLG